MGFVDFFAIATNPAQLGQYSQYILVMVLLFSFLEVVVPPIPGDTVLIIGSAVAGMTNINPVWVILCAFTGTFGASLLLYLLGVKLERKILVSPRYGWLLDSQTFQRIERWFERFGFWTLLLSRFLPVARSGVALAAGIVNYKKRVALTALAISVFLSATVFVLIGRFLGHRWQEVLEIWQFKLRWILVGIGLLAIMAIFLWWWKRRKSAVKFNRSSGESPRAAKFEENQ